MLLRTLVILFFISLCRVTAQEVQLGFRLESNSAIINNGGTTNLIVNSPTNININCDYFPNSNLGFELRLGGDLKAKFFTGMEAGLFAKYIIDRKYYVIGGAIMHDIDPYKYNDFATYSNSKLIFPSIGAGVLFTNGLLIELSALYCNNFEVGYKWITIYPSDGYLHSIPVYLDWITKVSVGYYFNL